MQVLSLPSNEPIAENIDVDPMVQRRVSDDNLAANDAALRVQPMPSHPFAPFYDQ